MINFKIHTLSNGLKLIHHFNATTRMVALNLLYKVGSKHENPERTGLAHLMEHLMFAGSKNVPDYDGALQHAGGTNNAWTNEDMTNYYDILPAQNIETAFWVESDRLLNLRLSEENVEIQKSVVSEEFKQHYLNRPYGDVPHLVRDMAYTKHPYKWPVIGVDLSHIENVSREEVLDFYHNNYSVDNMIMCVSGNIDEDKALKLAEKWFGDILPRKVKPLVAVEEPKQAIYREKKVVRPCPSKLIIRAYHIPGRKCVGYKYCDLLTDVLANGNSSRFYQNVMLKSDAFSELDASVNNLIDTSLLIIKAKLNNDVEYAEAESIIDKELNNLFNTPVTQYEIDKYVNKYISRDSFENSGYGEIAEKLCIMEHLGSASDINKEYDEYRAITPEQVIMSAQKYLQKNNCSTLYYGNE